LSRGFERVHPNSTKIQEYDRLILDAINHLDNNIQAIMEYVIGTGQSERIESFTKKILIVG
jgi:metal-responsive CopG/Arc/MetJ family transcriptional regulator